MANNTDYARSIEPLHTNLSLPVRKKCDKMLCQEALRTVAAQIMTQSEKRIYDALEERNTNLAFLFDLLPQYVDLRDNIPCRYE